MALNIDGFTPENSKWSVHAAAVSSSKSEVPCHKSYIRVKDFIDPNLHQASLWLDSLL